MFQKYFSLQYWMQHVLDGLFDEGWCTLGVPDGLETHEALLLLD